MSSTTTCVCVLRENIGETNGLGERSISNVHSYGALMLRDRSSVKNLVKSSMQAMPCFHFVSPSPKGEQNSSALHRKTIFPNGKNEALVM